MKHLCFSTTRAWVLAAVSWLAAGCATPHGNPMNDTPVTVAQQRRYTQCPWQGEAAAVFDTEAAWRAALGARAGEPLFEPPVDWSRQRVVAYTMDTQPSLGFGVELVAASVAQRGEVLRLPVRLIRPSPDRLQGMALTRPCVLAVVARGPWREVEVRDVDGDVLIGRATLR